MQKTNGESLYFDRRFVFATQNTQKYMGLVKTPELLFLCGCVINTSNSNVKKTIIQIRSHSQTSRILYCATIDAKSVLSST